MIRIIVTTREGQERAVEATLGRSVMEAIRNGGIDELLAICGGSCSCATCHVYVDPARLDDLSPPSPMEAELLDFSDHRRPNSRLSCQLAVQAGWEGLRVFIAPED